MKKIIEKDCYTIEIETLTKPNGVSCVATIKTFVKPKAFSKLNGNTVDTVENDVHSVCEAFVMESDLLSDNHILDFDCTRENLNPEKWSRMKVDLYLFTPFVECEDELISETIVLCEKIGCNIEGFIGKSGFEVAKSTL